MSVIKQPVTHILLARFGSKYRVCGVTMRGWIVRQRIIKDRELAKKYALRLARYYRVPIVGGIIKNPTKFPKVRDREAIGKQCEKCSKPAGYKLGYNHYVCRECYFLFHKFEDATYLGKYGKDWWDILYERWLSRKQSNPLLATAGTALLTGLGFGAGIVTARKLLGNSRKRLLNPIDEIAYRRELIAKIKQAIKGKRIIFQPQWLKTEQLEQFWKKVRIS